MALIWLLHLRIWRPSFHARHAHLANMSCTLACAGPDGGDRPLQLRELAARLRKADEPQALLQALTAAQPLIEAAPVELPHYAGACMLGLDSTFPVSC